MDAIENGSHFLSWFPFSILVPIFYLSTLASWLTCVQQPSSFSYSVGEGPAGAAAAAAAAPAAMTVEESQQ